MILKDLKIFSQNIQKNNFIINIILKVYFNFNIIFIQELSWTTLHSIPSHTNCKGGLLIEIANHPNQLTFAREPDTTNDCPRVVIFINIRLSSFRFSLHKDVINHRDILLTSFFNNGNIFQLMNIYLDSSHSMIKYLKNIEFNFQNLLVITEDFNIQDSLWDPSFNHHSSISDNLFAIVDSFKLSLLYPINQVSTRYSDNTNDSNSVINLMFLHYDFSKLNMHSIHPEWYLMSDHALLTITIPIIEEHIATHKRTITKISDKKDEFNKEVITSFSKLDVSSISNIPKLEEVILDFVNIVDHTWMKYSKLINITKHSKSWWNNKCNHNLTSYRSSKNIESWKMF